MPDIQTRELVMLIKRLASSLKAVKPDSCVVREAQDWLRDRKLYTVVTTSSEQGKPLFKTSLPAKMVLVLGQEYEGLPDAARDPNDLRVKIDGTGNVAGLNISVATGVLLGEWWRQNKA
ncbi:TrmH family RNA methyltransferase, partial [Escherichia coli]|uniref:TrmH family RNA methyltransferase n=1 Tax=Escherichia coli TaxID=562 RepID=UPI0025A5EADA